MSDRIVFACSCDETVALDGQAIGKACGGRLETADQLCGREIARFEDALVQGAPVTVSCTLQAPLFTDIAAGSGADARVTYANIRENAGWSKEASAVAVASSTMPLAVSTWTMVGS